MLAARTQPTVCRLCESACGLIATVDDAGDVTLAPDRAHPVSAGFACRKGLGFGRIHAHPTRLLQPRLRGASGARDVTWNEAWAEVGGRLRALRAAHGPDAIGIYSGNAAGHSLGTVLGLEALHRGLGTRRHFSCLTLDNSGMFVVLDAVLGNPMRSFLADYAGSDHVVLIGTDPLVSQPSQAQSNPDGVRQLLRAGDRLTVIDPRASATARRAAHHLAPIPGSDVHLLAWLLHAVLASGRRDPWLDAADVDAVARAVAPWASRDAVVLATGLPPDALAGLLERLLAARRPLVWSGLGVLLGPHGTVGYWLTLALQAALGGLDVAGGWVHQPGAVDIPSLGRRIGLRGADPTLRARTGHAAVLGTIAAATLADDILAGDLRALIVVGGNPLLSLPDSDRARAALSKLDLLVCVDLFENDTGRLAHALLPAADWLERDEVAVHLAHTRARPHLDRVRAVVPRRGDVRSDWEILIGLAHAAGRPAFGSRVADVAVRAGLGPSHVARLALATAGAPAETPGVLRRRGTDRPDGRVRLAAPELMDALAAIGGPRAAPVGFTLVTSVRPVESMNTWDHYRVRDAPVASLHPADLAALGAADGSTIRLSRPDGPSLRVAVAADDSLRRGVVVLPFGWGEGTGLSAPGPNANVLVGVDALDAITGQPVSNGARVQVEAG